MTTITTEQTDDELLNSAPAEKLMAGIDASLNFSTQLLKDGDGDFIIFDYSSGPWTHFLGVDADRNPETDAPFEPGVKVFYEKRRGDYYPLGTVIDHKTLSRDELIEVIKNNELDWEVLDHGGDE
jgi:hypothetical protein